jgi:DNA-binding LacI/PurR family transcriptional regulator
MPGKMMNNPTIRDIAQRAAVSASTVSRALNGHPHVDEETRLVVQRAVEELGYSLANLRKGNQLTPPESSRTILLLMRDDENAFGKTNNVVTREFEREVWGGVQAVFQRSDYNLNVQRSSMEYTDLQKQLENEKVDGLILVGGIIDQSVIEGLNLNNLPIVVAGAHLHSLKIDCVMADIRNGMEQAVTHLASTGRRRIGLVNGPATTRTSQEKYNGLFMALHLQGLEFNPAWVVSCDFRPEMSYQKTIELIKGHPDLDAIIFGDDAMAMGGIRALKESQRRIPEDVAVIGFHDYEIAQFTDPPLTSVHFDQRQVGQMAARRLMLLLEEPAEERQPWLILAPTQLVVRQSSLLNPNGT